MRYLSILFFLLLLISCKSNKDFFNIRFIKEKGLELSFYSEKDTSFVIDVKAFGDECYNKETKGLIIKNNKNVDSIACKINYNQAVIIDQNNDMRFLTDGFSLPNEFKELVMINCMEDWNHKIDLKAKKVYSFLLEKRYTSDLMVTEETSKIKIIYLHKEADTNKCASIMESNWVDIE